MPEPYEILVTCKAMEMHDDDEMVVVFDIKDTLVEFIMGKERSRNYVVGESYRLTIQV